MLIDDRLAMIATFNFCEKYFTHTRDYGLVTERPAEVTRNPKLLRSGLGPPIVPSRVRHCIAVEQP